MFGNLLNTYKKYSPFHNIALLNGKNDLKDSGFIKDSK